MDHQKKWGDKIKMGEYELSNRVCLAALTRQRCDPNDGVPNQLMKEYYTQRSGAGLMLTEAAAWTQRGEAFPGAGNIYNKQHVEGWRKIIEAVHQRNTKIFIQIFHAGRATHEKINRGMQVWAPSPVACRQTIRVLDSIPYPVPKQMTHEEIKQTQQQFRNSVMLAKEAGFDGVQIHGAHGYLIDSFLRTSSNHRTDQYGGNAEKRCRYCLQVFDIALEYFQPWQLGIKISPVSRLRDQFDENPLQTYSYLLQELSKKNIGFVEIRQSTQVTPIKSKYEIQPFQQIQNVCKTLRPFFNGLIIANDSFTSEKGLEAIQNGWADMVSFGRLYVSNPDLAERILNGWEVNPNWDYKTFYGTWHGKIGYTDYPFYNTGKEE